MRQMKVQTKIFALLLAMAVLILSSLVIIKKLERNRLDAMFVSRKEEISASFANILELQGRPLKTMVFDYSYWDEMLTFVSSGDRTWARINIDESMANFKTKAVWVYKKNCSLVYFWSNIATLSNKELPAQKLCKLFTESPFRHFYLKHGDVVLEIFTAPIQPSADTERKTPAAGYLIAAKQLSLEEMASVLPSTELKIIAPDQDNCLHPDTDKGIFTMTLNLPGCDGEVIAKICGCHKSGVYENAYKAQRSEQLTLIVLGSLCLAFLYFLLKTWITKPLDLISQSLDSESSGALEHASFPGVEFARIGKLITAFFHQRDSLRQEIVERKKVEETLAQFATKIIAVREEEKKKIARDIHDELGSHETVIGSLLTMAEAALSENNAAQAAENIATARQMLKELSRMTRNVSAELMPIGIEVSGLEGVVSELVDKLNKSSAMGITLHAKLGEESSLDAKTKIIVYRIVQESLQNAIKHSRATQATVVLNLTNGKLLVKITDNGRGFNTAAATGKTEHLGLQSIHEYARAINACVAITSEVDKGTSIEVKSVLPI